MKLSTLKKAWRRICETRDCGNIEFHDIVNRIRDAGGYVENDSDTPNPSRDKFNAGKVTSDQLGSALAGGHLP